MDTPAYIPAESAGWESAHYEEPYYSRRTAKLGPKLKRLGLGSLPRDIRILDACCGRGEALAALRGLGFRNLTGIDATPQPKTTSTSPELHHGDVQHMPFPDATFDLIINLHALHHMGDAEGVARFLQECHRVLKPGGTLGIIDFPSSPQIRVLFWLLRNRVFTITGGLRNFARIVDEEWDYLCPYLDQWPSVKDAIALAPFETTRKQVGPFLYYWMLRSV